MFLSENVIFQGLRLSLGHFGQQAPESPVSQLQNGVSTSSLPPFIEDLLTFKDYLRSNSFFQWEFQRVLKGKPRRWLTMGRNSSGSAISVLYGIFVLNSMVESLWPTLDFPTTSVYEILTRLHVIDELQQIFYLLSMILDCLGQVFGLLLVHAYLRRQDHRIWGSHKKHDTLEEKKSFGFVF